MLVFHAAPSTTAVTGVRPHGLVTGGAKRLGMGAKVHPPFPGYRKSRLANGPRRSTRGCCLASPVDSYRYHHRLPARFHTAGRVLVKRLRQAVNDRRRPTMQLFDVQGVEILAPRAKVFEFLKRPENLPQWAHAFVSAGRR
jgi:hypothetical protein